LPDVVGIVLPVCTVTRGEVVVERWWVGGGGGGDV